MTRGLIAEQIAFASTINPAGDIVPCWQAYLQNYVNRESWLEWARTPESRPLADDIHFSKKKWSLRNFIGMFIP